MVEVAVARPKILDCGTQGMDGRGRPVFRKSDGGRCVGAAARRFCYGFDSRPCATCNQPVTGHAMLMGQAQGSERSPRQGLYFTGMRDLKESNREPGLIKTGIYTTLVVYTTSVTVGI